MRPNYRSFKVNVQFARKEILASSFAHLNGVRESELVNPYLTDRDYISAANNYFHSRRWLDAHPNSRMLHISGSQFHLLKSSVDITSSYTFLLKAITRQHIFLHESCIYSFDIISTLRFITFFCLHLLFFNSLCLDNISCIHLSLYFFSLSPSNFANSFSTDHDFSLLLTFYLPVCNTFTNAYLLICITLFFFFPSLWKSLTSLSKSS
jgi:hypothetical protein